ncbi:SET domain-containing protein, partial [Lizonia empirigonia]
LGAYLGELNPTRTENTDYCHEVAIGPEFEKTGAPVAYIDAEKCGNYVRFCNHSCESNAKIYSARVGKERILALRATKHIAAGEQICIDYGTEYFQSRQCLC